MADWRTVARRVDDGLDRRFGERARITPWMSDDYSSGYDPNRPAVVVEKAVFVTANDQAMNLAGDHAGEPFRSRIAVTNFGLWVQTKLIAAIDVREGDRVTLLDVERNGASYEINRVVHGPTGRTYLSLVFA